MQPMRLSIEGVLSSHSEFQDIWVDGIRHELAPNGDTLIAMPETRDRGFECAERIADLESPN